MNDGDLVRRVREGDTAAFATLYRTHAPAVHRVVSAVAGRADAPDSVQDVFVRALERLPALRSPERFRPWLLAIARNVAMDTLRARGRVTIVRSDDGAEDVAGDGLDPDQEAELAELTALVRGAVAGLAARDAAAVAMVTQLGYSVAEVATVLGVSHGAAKVLLHRARRRLRDALALEVLVRCRADGCVELRAIDRDDVVVAGRHIRGCAACLEAARRELQVSDWSRTPHTRPGALTSPARAARFDHAAQDHAAQDHATQDHAAQDHAAHDLSAHDLSAAMAG